MSALADGSARTELELVREAFERTAVGLVVITPDGVFRHVNAAFCEMTGLPWHDVRSCSDRDVLRELNDPPMGLDGFLASWDRLRDAMADMLRANGLPFALGPQTR